MTIEDALRAYLITQDTVTELLADIDSIRTDLEPQGAPRPFIRIEMLNLQLLHDAAATATLAEASITLHCEGTTRTKARTIAEVIRILFRNGYQGLMDNLAVRRVAVTSISDRPRFVFAGKEQGLPASTIDLQIHFIMDNDEI